MEIMKHEKIKLAITTYVKNKEPITIQDLWGYAIEYCTINGLTMGGSYCSDGDRISVLMYDEKQYPIRFKIKLADVACV
jgi:hypothetical protein